MQLQNVFSIRSRNIRRQVAQIIVIGLTGTIATVFTAQAAEPTEPPASIWEQDTLTGDWGGARTALKEKNGIEFKIEYTDEVFGVMTGGVRREPSYEGQLHFSVNTDLDKLIGWSGAKTHFTVFQIHDSGHNVIENSGSIADPSNIDALPTTRLFTAWFEQASATVSRYASAKSSPTANSSPATRPAT